MLTRLCFFCLILMFLSGCTHTIGKYHPSAEQVKALKNNLAKSDNKIKNISLVNGQHESNSLMCRAEGPIEPPNGLSYESYVLQALLYDLKVAGLLSEDGNISLEIKFEDISFSSVTSQWTIQALFLPSTNESFSVKTEHDFEYNFVARIACMKVGREFPLAVQQFNQDVTQNQKFKKLFKQR